MVPVQDGERSGFEARAGFTEPQSSLTWKRSVKPSIYILTQHCQVHLIYTSFKCLQDWRLHHFLGKPIPMPENSFGERIFPNIKTKPPLAQFKAISYCHISCCLGEKTDPHLTTTHFQVAIRSPLSHLFFQVNNCIPCKTCAPVLLPFSGLSPPPQCLFCSEGPKTGHRI